MINGSPIHSLHPTMAGPKFQCRAIDVVSSELGSEVVVLLNGQDYAA